MHYRNPHYDHYEPSTEAEYREALKTEKDFILRERYQRRLLELRGITPLNSMAALGSAIENCQAELESHGYPLYRELGAGSAGYVYHSGPGQVTKITRSPMEAAIAQLLVGDPFSCFPIIDQVEDITLLCDSEIPMFAIKREQIDDFKVGENLVLWPAVDYMFKLIRQYWGSPWCHEEITKIKERYPLDEEEIIQLVDFANCIIATKQKYNLILRDLGPLI